MPHHHPAPEGDLDPFDTWGAIRDQMREPTRWLLVVVGDCAPDLSGPFPDDATRLRAARAYRAREGDQDGLYCLDVPDPPAKPVVSAFDGEELEGDCA